MRVCIALAIVCLLAGCGSSSSAGPTATPAVTNTPLIGPTVPPVSHTMSFSKPPPMTINVNHIYSAVVKTTDGTFTIHLLPKIAPITVNNFVFLARHKFFTHILFHRIIRPFMIQTGDPTGTGGGGPGYTIKDEKVTMQYLPGVVAMAKTASPNSGGSQFFIVTGPQGRTLTPNYTIFGKVSSGMSVVAKIAATPVGQNPGTGELSDPMTDVYMESVTIQESK